MFLLKANKQADLRLFIGHTPGRIGYQPEFGGQSALERGFEDVNVLFTVWMRQKQSIFKKVLEASLRNKESS